MTKVKAERAIADTPEAEVLKEAIFVGVRACAPKMKAEVLKEAIFVAVRACAPKMISTLKK